MYFFQAAVAQKYMVSQGDLIYRNFYSNAIIIDVLKTNGKSINMLIRRIPLTLLVIIFVGLVTSQSTDLPDPVQIYRYIKVTSDERAGDVRWIEIWETQNRAQNDRQWVMIDLEGNADGGITSTCYHALALGSGSPVYFVNDQLVPVANAQQMLDEIANRRLVDQSLLYVEEFVENFDSIAVLGEETVAGIPSQRRELVDQDATNLFLIKPPATSTAQLWTAVDGDYVTRYEFTADGSTGDVTHVYRLQEGGSIEPPSEVNMQCFDGPFPQDEGMQPLVEGNLTHSSFRSDASIDDLRGFYDEELTPAWESAGNTPQGGRVYTRSMDNGSVCRLGLQFQSDPSGGTVMTARVIPEAVSEETFSDITAEFTSPVVVQTASNFAFSFAGTVQDAVESVVIDLEADGWVRRPELTDIRETSALVTLTKDSVDTHVIIDGNGINANIRIQQREPVCGPTFAVP